MTSKKFFSALALAMLYAGSHAFGHGFTLSQTEGGLLLDTQGSSRANRVGYIAPPPTENENSGNPYTFAHPLDSPGGALYDMNHGSVGLVSNELDDLDLSDTYYLEFAGPLWFSDGGAAVPSPSSLAGSSLSSTALEIDTHTLNGSTLFGETMLVSGHSSHSIVWTLDDAAANGVYALAYRVLWDDAGGAVDYVASNWVTLLAVTPDFEADSDLLDAELAVVAAAVPEPSAMALLVCAVATCGAASVLRRRRTRTRPWN